MNGGVAPSPDEGGGGGDGRPCCSCFPCAALALAKEMRLVSARAVPASVGAALGSKGL